MFKRPLELFSKDYYQLIPKEPRDNDKIHQFLKKNLIPKEYNFKAKSNGNHIIVNHPLLGKKVQSGREIGVIEQVNLQHWMGWYYALLINYNGSHAFVLYKNVNSICPINQEQFSQFSKKHKII